MRRAAAAERTRAGAKLAPRMGLALSLGLALLGRPAPVQANPNEGEARPIVRDADRVYTVVAGEGDGASTVTNPANLGYLRGVNGVLDFSLMSPDRRRRGSGAGLMVGLPLPLRLASLGLGYQLLLPWQPESATSDDTTTLGAEPRGSDDFYSKVSFGLAVPLGSWVRLLRRGSGIVRSRVDGLSLGLGVSRLLSSGNFDAHGITQVDVALSYWPIRFLALGVVGRAINVPRSGPVEFTTIVEPADPTDPNDEETRETTVSSTVQPAVIDPELAIRPFGTPVLDLAFGARITPVLSQDRRYQTNYVDPRARVIASVRGVRVFAEAELMRFNPVIADDIDAGTRVAARVNAGIELNFSHFGMAVAPLMSGGARSTYGIDGAAMRMRVSQERYPTLAGRPRVVTKLVLAKARGDRGMWAMVREIDEAAERRGVVLIETRGMSLGYAQLEELREAILRVRNRGGKVVVYLNGGSLRSYFLASAADRIIAHPNASLSILGMRIQTLYYAELLDKLGAKAEFLRVAEYKAWPEKVHRRTASEPVAKQRRQLHVDVWNHVLRTIARERGQDARVVQEWIDEGPLRPDRAVRRGLVDQLAFPDELDAKLEQWLGRKIRIELPAASREHAVDFGPPPRIAVVLVQGDLVQGDSFTVPLLGRRVTGDRTLTKEIERLRKDPSVQAVVVRIDSPGGDVWTADAIARELDLLRKVKPVVISMGNTCASGGYYIATAGQYIFADATTFTGSIGIFYPKLDVSGTLDKLGISVDEEDFGQRAGMRSWLRPYDDDERDAVQADIEASYAEFVRRVAQARSMTPEQADRVARGRVWSGVRAIEEGLVDDYGGLREAILRARAIAGMSPDQGVVEVLPRPAGAVENLQAMFGFAVPSPLGEDGGFGAAVPAAMALRSVLPMGMVLALRQLPVPLWWSDGPRLMALAETDWVIED